MRVLDSDPELGRGLDEAAAARARPAAVARLRTLSRGPWTPAVAGGSPPPGHLGFLVLDGLLARDVLLGGGTATELLGPGDLVRPWADVPAEGLVPFDVRWCVLEPARLAELDPAFAAIAGREPALLAALLGRSSAEALRLAVSQAICQLTGVHARLLLVLWQLAERWGRVGSDGVVLPLRLSHRTLGQLVGATRPSVSSALKGLEARGSVRLRRDGAWLLVGAGPPPEVCGTERVAARAGWRPPSLVRRSSAPLSVRGTPRSG